MMVTAYHSRFNTPGKLYAIQTRHCVHNSMPVFKLGRTRDFKRRQGQYPKGSRVVACMSVSHMIDSERMLLALCRKNFVPRLDFGREYFEGNVCDIVATLVAVVAHFPMTAALPPPSLMSCSLFLRSLVALILAPAHASARKVMTVVPHLPYRTCIANNTKQASLKHLAKTLPTCFPRSHGASPVPA